MPGVSYERGVQFTPHGPVAIHIVRGPRPTGLYALRPVLSNESIQGLERVTAMQKRLSSTATMVGVNGDFFAASGRPSGVLMRDGVVDSPPYGDRSSVGVLPEGALDVRRVEFFGTWRGLGQRRTLNDLNQSPGANSFSLFTPSYGPATPQGSGTTEVVIAPFPPATPNTDLFGPVVHVAGAGGTTIPRDGAVLVARGTAAARLAEEAPIGTELTLRLIFRPEWTGVTDAVGGGPVLVRSGGPVFRANEAFTSSQLAPRAARTGVGQLADGRILLVVADGRRPGYSVGMTNFELAQTLVRLGAVTGSALRRRRLLDAGLQRHAAEPPVRLGRRAPVRERSPAHVLRGLRADAGRRRLAERRRLRRAAAPALVQGRAALDGDRDARRPGRGAGLHREPGAAAGDVPRRLPARAGRSVGGAGAPGRGPLAARRDGDRRSRQTSTTSQRFTVNNTLGFARLSRRTLVVRVRGKQTIQAGVTLTRAARVTATVETKSGRPGRHDLDPTRCRRPLRRELARHHPWRQVARLRRHVRGPLPRDERARRRRRRQHAVPRHPRSARAGQEAAAEGVTSARCRSRRSCRRSLTSSRPWSATTASTRSFG